MKHAIHKVTSFEIAGRFTLRVCFDDATEQTIDFEPVLKGELFGPLADPQVFQQVALDTEAHTLLWPNGADFDPATLHDWPDHETAMKEMVQRWEAEGAEDAGAVAGRSRESNQRA